MSQQLTKFGLIAIILLAALAGGAITFIIVKTSKPVTTEAVQLYCPDVETQDENNQENTFKWTRPKNTGRNKEY